ncbi:inorganic phosphate transporter 1-11-like [Senna tora]|uniref:Inorganic phosphate transporter 1-11-like n=1 Tax=Senna tora TaxID=362788 RepID=A0A834TU36_9FABA|nr:inorganic phosphate transporter 1-11-like [Senna tora]
MGFFTNACDLFCITTITMLLGRLYYFDPSSPKPGKHHPNVNNVVVSVALVGTLCGQLVFGWLGDKLGRKKVYSITLIFMVLYAICSGISLPKERFFFLDGKSNNGSKNLQYSIALL